jgi:hypothetical protein
MDSSGNLHGLADGAGRAMLETDDSRPKFWQDDTTHWHACAWMGHENPRDSERNQNTGKIPPLVIAQWLAKRSDAFDGVFDRDLEGRKAALDWMREGGEEQVHLDDAAFPLAARLEYVEDDLKRGADVVWGYYSQKQRYVSRVLIACPRPGASCPTRRA